MRLATVTNTSPLEVRRDGDRLPVPAVGTAVTVSINDRALVETLDNQVYIIVKLT